MTTYEFLTCACGNQMRVFRVRRGMRFGPPFEVCQRCGWYHAQDRSNEWEVMSGFEKARLVASVGYWAALWAFAGAGLGTVFDVSMLGHDRITWISWAIGVPWVALVAWVFLRDTLSELAESRTRMTDPQYRAQVLRYLSVTRGASG